MKLKQTLVLLGAIAAGSSGFANTITPELTGAFLPGTWTYSVKLTSGELHAGDGFTIFDFGGYVGGSIAAPGGWVASTSATGSPWGVAPLGPDTGDVNLTWTYVGAPVEAVFGAIPFGPFTAVTTSTTFVTDNWVSRDHLIGAPGFIDGALGPGDKGNILVPGPVVVPDGGATAMLLGVGVLALGAVRRKRS